MNSLDDLKISVVYMPVSLEKNSRNPIEKVTEISIVHDQFQNGECFLDLSHITRASRVTKIFRRSKKSIISTYIFDAATTYFSSFKKTIFCFYEPYLCNFQPIYNALRHIFSGTTYILFFNLLSPLAFHTHCILCIHCLSLIQCIYKCWFCDF